MYSISVPFSFNSTGGTKTTSDVKKIIEQQIIDVLTTSNGDRVMRPQYGANYRNLLFEPADELIFSEYSVDAINDINETLEFGKVLDIQIRVPETDFYSDPSDGTVSIYVRYVAPPDTISVVSFDIVNSNYILSGGMF